MNQDYKIVIVIKHRYMNQEVYFTKQWIIFIKISNFKYFINTEPGSNE